MKTVHYCKICKINKICYKTFKYGKKMCSSCMGKLYSKIRKGKNTARWKGGITNKKYYCIECNNRIGIFSGLYGTKLCGSCSKKNKIFTKQHIRKLKSANIGKHKGKKNPMFGKIGHHGISGKYKGIFMRSSWEMLFARFLTLSGIKWSYESRTFDLKTTTYTPDFYLPEFDCYIEIKGWWRDDAKKKYRKFFQTYKNINIKILMKKELQQFGVL